jgi:hypothetical protein
MTLVKLQFIWLLEKWDCILSRLRKCTTQKYKFLKYHRFIFIFSLCAIAFLHMLPLYFATWLLGTISHAPLTWMPTRCSCLVCVGVEVGDAILLLVPPCLGPSRVVLVVHSQLAKWSCAWGSADPVEVLSDSAWARVHLGVGLHAPDCTMEDGQRPASCHAPRRASWGFESLDLVLVIEWQT